LLHISIHAGQLSLIEIEVGELSLKLRGQLSVELGLCLCLRLHLGLSLSLVLVHVHGVLARRGIVDGVDILLMCGWSHHALLLVHLHHLRLPVDVQSLELLSGRLEDSKLLLETLLLLRQVRIRVQQPGVQVGIDGFLNLVQFELWGR
jgi:hypothetical protein